jgi:hypothetical protein
MGIDVWTSSRASLREYLYDNLPSFMTESDLNVFIDLICFVFGDLYQEAGQLPWEIDIDKCSDEDLVHLAKLVKYPWNNALTSQQQRETIKYWMLIKRNRGTSFSYINLIRLFGKDSTTYYSNADHSGVRVIEYDPNVTHDYKLYPGDIRIEVPEMSTILRSSLKDIQLMGTRILFAFVIYLGAYSEEMSPELWYEINKWINTDVLQGWNPMIKNYGPQYEYTKISRVYDWQLCFPSRSNEMFASVYLLQQYREPWIKGFIFNTKGLDNYRGILTSDGIINATDVLYK